MFVVDFLDLLQNKYMCNFEYSFYTYQGFVQDFLLCMCRVVGHTYSINTGHLAIFNIVCVFGEGGGRKMMC